MKVTDLLHVDEDSQVLETIDYHHSHIHTPVPGCVMAIRQYYGHSVRGSVEIGIS